MASKTLVKPTLNWFLPRVTVVVFVSFSAGALRTILSLYLPSTSVRGSAELGIILASAGIAGLNIGKSFGAFFTSRYVETVSEYTFNFLSGSLILLGGILSLFNSVIAISSGLFIVGFGLGVALTSSMGIGVSKFTSKYRGIVLGVLEVSTYVSISLGSFFIGFVSQVASLELTGFLVIMLGIITISTIIVMFKTRDEGGKEGAITTPLRLKDVIVPPVTNKTIIMTFILGFLAKTTEFTIATLIPYILIQAFQASNAVVASTLGFFTIGWASTLVIGARIGDKYGRKWLVVIGLIGQALGLYWLVQTGDRFQALPAFVIGVSIGIYYSSIAAIASDVVPPSIRKRLLGSYRVIADLTPFVDIIVLSLVMGLFLGLHRSFDTVIAKWLVISVSFAIGFYALFYALFAPETNPLWIHLGDLIEHLESSKSLLAIGQEMIPLFSTGEIELLQQYLAKAKQAERKADRVVEKMKKALLGGIKPGEVSKYFVGTVLLQDKAIGHVYRGIRLLTWLSMGGTEIPKIYLKHLEEQLILLNDLADRLEKAVKSVVQEITSFKELQMGVKLVEEELDAIYDGVMLELISKGSQIDYIHFSVLKETVDHFEKAANLLEDASDTFMELIYTIIS